MWILETEGDIFKGKKLWLRPGKKYLFGRTASTDAAAGGGFVVSEKTISRKHLTVEVEASETNDCGKPRSRSKVTLHDQGSKIGTKLNGVSITGKSCVLESDVNKVTLGKYEHDFSFTWVPVNLSFFFTGKELKEKPHLKLYERLGPLDIKVLVDYDSIHTTHVLTKKRNTPMGLQALIDGRYIASPDTFIRAIEDAVAPNYEGLSPLEADFEANFPNGLDHLPPPGSEPTKRHGSEYQPDSRRQNMFDGYTFVFYKQKQFQTLLAPVTQGRGKALFQAVEERKSEVDDFVRYVKGVAGEKGLGEFEDGSEGKGVVVVRYNAKEGEDIEWWSDFGTQVSLRLGHRLVEQNEFLDAILGADASVLRRALEVDMSGILPPPPTAVSAPHTQSNLPPTQAEELAPSEPTRRGRSRRLGASRFKGFDDDDDFGTPVQPVVDNMEVDPSPAVQSQSLFVSQDPDIEALRDPSPEPPKRNTRKRAAPIEEINIIETMAPAATALKKRRIAEETARRRRGEPSPEPVFVPKEEPLVLERVQAKKPKPQVDGMELARQQQEKAEKLAQEDREAMRRELEGLDIDTFRPPIEILEMEVTRANPPLRAASRADESDRWDDHWNGRKNFKKFRRRGADDGNARNMHRVIVQLEKVEAKTNGIGDGYWLEEDLDTQQRKKKGKEREMQSQSQSQAKGKARDKASETPTRENEKDRSASRVEIELSDSSDLEDMDNIQQQKPAAKSQRSQTLVDKTNKSKNLPANANNKRPPATVLTKPAPAKKVKQTLARKEESDDSDDGLRFKFRRR